MGNMLLAVPGGRVIVGMTWKYPIASPMANSQGPIVAEKLGEICSPAVRR